MDYVDGQGAIENVLYERCDTGNSHFRTQGKSLHKASRTNVWIKELQYLDADTAERFNAEGASRSEELRVKFNKIA